MFFLNISNEDDEEDTNNYCFRCGREGHYASKHIKGYYLK
jgi:hypothetical protein